jgi:hypothetical protein
VTKEGARTAANVALGLAGAAMAYVVLTTPPLRRAAFWGLRVWLGASVPVYLMREARQAWLRSGRAA